MDSTGRISGSLRDDVRRIVFGENADAAIGDELFHSSEVDLAHVVMLAERAIIAPDAARAIVHEIAALRASEFAPLRGRAATRGLYLLYESYLIETLGADIGGVLHTGRSRNDLNATVLRLRMRRPYHRLLGAAVELLVLLAEQADRFRSLVMPLYTQHQAALPITLGHYLAGVGLALARHIDALVYASGDLDRCPLGAGAGGGTSIPIEPARTAALLGFTDVAVNSVDAVASRDLVLALLSAMAVLGVTLSRLAADLSTWTTAEFGFIALPDHLVGSSSMMPQKRNPYLLEHVKGRSATALGGLTSAMMSMHATPFSNMVAVGTEAVKHLWPSLQDTADAVELARAVLAGLEANEQAMLDRVRAGYTTATALCERLVVMDGMPFRSAHHLVGEIVTAAVARGEDLASAAVRVLGPDSRAAEGLEPGPAARHGGGPAGPSMDLSLHVIGNCVERFRARIAARERAWAAARASLSREIASMGLGAGHDTERVRREASSSRPWESR